MYFYVSRVSSAISFCHPHRPSLASNLQKGGCITFNKVSNLAIVMLDTVHIVYFSSAMGQVVCADALFELRCWWRSDPACTVEIDERRTRQPRPKGEIYVIIEMKILECPTYQLHAARTNLLRSVDPIITDILWVTLLCRAI